MDAVLHKLKRLMEEKGIEVVEFPPCEQLNISLLRFSDVYTHTHTHTHTYTHTSVAHCSPYSPFTGKEDLEEAESEDGIAKVKKKPTTLGGNPEQEDAEGGLSSLVHTTLHGNCCPVIVYRLVRGSSSPSPPPPPPSSPLLCTLSYSALSTPPLC